MSDGGKGSKPRPFSVDKETFDNNWDRIFMKNDYQDILSTEECIEEVIYEMQQSGGISPERGLTLPK